MNTFSNQENYIPVLEKIKPLVVLYCEDFGVKDSKTNKPILSPENIAKLKTRILEHGISEDLWNQCVRDLDTIPVTMAIRKHLKEVKKNSDSAGNVYHDKETILQKILQILEV